MIIANCGFLLLYELLGSIAQDIKNNDLQATTISIAITTTTIYTIVV